MRSGISRRCAEAVVLEMQGLGYVNEERQILRLIISEANERLHGPKKILSRLLSKGYSPEKIKAAIRRLEIEGQISFERNKKNLLATVTDADEARKLLYKKGY